MSLDLDLVLDDYNVFECNVTHNLNKMASACGIYEAMWRPDEHGFDKASDITDILIRGFTELLSKPDCYKKYNPDNGWGSYDGFIDVLFKLIKACNTYPDAIIKASR